MHGSKILQEHGLSERFVGTKGINASLYLPVTVVCAERVQK